MQKRHSLTAFAVALLAAASLGGRMARASADFCLIPPHTRDAARQGFSTDVWRDLSARAGKRSSGATLLAAAVKPQLPPSVGKLNALVLLVEFEDTRGERPNLEMRNLFFGTQRDSPLGSVAQYYDENSYGKLKMSGVALGDPRTSANDDPDPATRAKWIRMPQQYGWYANNDFGFGAAPRNAQQLVADALTEAQNLYPSFDWSQFDQNKDGFVDLLVILHAGPGAEGSTDPSQIWSHRSSLNVDFELAPTSPAGTSLKVHDYAMVAENNNTGVFAHEIGHVLGLPDQYIIPQGQGEGLGDWSIMASGSNLPASPANVATLRPTHFDPWSKIQLGWLTPTVLSKSQTNLKLQPIEISPTIYKILTNAANPKEYYLLENRAASPGTYDAALADLPGSGIPGFGLMIYQVDDARTANDDVGHPRIRVIEADAGDQVKGQIWAKGFGLLLPDGHPLQDRGDDGDPFGDKHRNFDNRTIPPAINYDGEDSGVRLSNISKFEADKTGTAISPNATFDLKLIAIQANVFTTSTGRIPAYSVRVLTTDDQPVKTAAIVIQSSLFSVSEIDPGDYFLEITATGFIPQKIPAHKEDGPLVYRVFLTSQPASTDFSPGWNLVSLPFDYAGAPTVTAAFGQPNLRVLSWDGMAYVSDPKAVPGKAYWVYLTDTKGIQFTLPGVAVSIEKDREIPLKKGWNLVGNPFPRGIAWNPSTIRLTTPAGDDLSLDAALDAGIARNTGWLYTPSIKNYLPLRLGDPIQPFQGFWFYSAVDGTLVMPAPSPVTPTLPR